MKKTITKEFGLDNLSTPPGVEILYTTWTVKNHDTGEVVYHIDRDDENLTSKIFTGVFEIGKTYAVTMSMVRSDGPTIQSEPFIVKATDNADIIDLYPMPSAVDNPVLTAEYTYNALPTSNFTITAGPISVAGNAVHESSSWWLVDDENNVIFRSLDDRANLNSITVRNVVLSPDRIYTMMCVFKASNNDCSGIGSLTFGVSKMSELDILGNLNDSYYNNEIRTRLVLNGTGVDKFEYELRTNNGTLLYADTNNTGGIYIPERVNGNIVLNQSDGVEFYILRMRLTTGVEIIGWKEVIFKPKEWFVGSDVMDDANFSNYTALSAKRITIEGCRPDTFNNVHPKGLIHQLPDDLFLMRYADTKYGLFSWINESSKFKLVRDVDLLGLLPASTGTNDWIFSVKVMRNGLVVVQPRKETVDANPIYVLEYNTVSKEFKYIRKTTGIMITAPSLGNNHIALIENNLVMTYNTATGDRYAMGDIPFVDNGTNLIFFRLNPTRFKVHNIVDKKSVIVTIGADYKSGSVSNIIDDDFEIGENWTTRSVLNNGRSYLYPRTIGGTGLVRLYGMNSNITATAYHIEGDNDITGILDTEIVMNDGRKIFFNTIAPSKSLIFS